MHTTHIHLYICDYICSLICSHVYSYVYICRYEINTNDNDERGLMGFALRRFCIYLAPPTACWVLSRLSGSLQLRRLLLPTAWLPISISRLHFLTFSPALPPFLFFQRFIIFDAFIAAFHHICGTNEHWLLLAVSTLNVIIFIWLCM